MRKNTRQILTRGVACLLSALLCLGCIGTDWMGLVPGSSDGITTALDARAASLPAGVQAGGVYYDAGEALAKPGRNGNIDFNEVRSFLAGADPVTLPGTTNVGASPDDPFTAYGETDPHSADYGAAMPDAAGTPYFYVAKGVAGAGASADAVDIEWEVWCWAQSNGTDALRTSVRGATTTTLAQALWDQSMPWEEASPVWVSGTDDYSDWAENGNYGAYGTTHSGIYGSSALTWSPDRDAFWAVLRTEPYQWGVDYSQAGGRVVTAIDSPSAAGATPGISYVANPFGAKPASTTVGAAMLPDFMANVDESGVPVSHFGEDGELYAGEVPGTSFLDYMNGHVDVSGARAAAVNDADDAAPSADSVQSVDGPSAGATTDFSQPGSFGGGIQGVQPSGGDQDVEQDGDAEQDGGEVDGEGTDSGNADSGMDGAVAPVVIPDVGQEDGNVVADPGAADPEDPADGLDGSDGDPVEGEQLSEDPKAATITDPLSIRWNYPAYDMAGLLSDLYENARDDILSIRAGTPIGITDASGNKSQLSGDELAALNQVDVVRGYRIYGVEVGVMARPGGIWYGPAENGAGARAFRSTDGMVANTCNNTAEERAKAATPYLPGAARYATGISVDGGATALDVLAWTRAYVNGTYSGAMLLPFGTTAGNANGMKTLAEFAPAMSGTEVYTAYAADGARSAAAAALDANEAVLSNTQIPMEVRAELFFDVTKDYQRGHGTISASGTPTASADPAAITATAARADSTGAQEAPAAANSVIVDTVSYSGMAVSASYTLQAGVYLESDFDAAGNLRTGATALASVGPVTLSPQGSALTANRELTAADNNATVQVVAGSSTIQVRFPAIDTTGAYANQGLIVRQTLMDGTNASTHGSNRTPEQRVVFRSDTVGLIGSAYSGTSSLPNVKYIDGVDNEIIRDDVTWSNLQAGRYMLEGTLHDARNGQRLNVPARQATFQVGAEVTGRVSMDFVLSGGAGKPMRGGDIVVCQYLYRNGTSTLDSLVGDAASVTAAGTAYDAWLARVRAYAEIIRNKESRPGSLASLAANAATYSDGAKAGIVNYLGGLKSNTGVVKDGWELVLAYDAMSNASQTVHVQSIAVDTEFVDANTRGHSVIPSDSIQVSDQISYRNLVPGCDYEIEVTVVNRRTGAPYADDDGRESILRQEVTAAYADQSFSADIEFRNMAGKLVGTDAVSTNKLYRLFKDVRGNVAYREEVASETDLSNARQTVTFAKDSSVPAIVSTTALNAETRTQSLPISSTVTVRDLVEYAGLEPRKTYSLVTQVYDRTDDRILRSVGNVVNEFTPRYSTGTESVEFSMDTSGLAGHRLVIYEILCEGSRGEVVLDTHDDPNDSNQTLRVGQDNGNPYIDTSAAAGSRDGTLIIDKNAVIVDTVNYMNLAPGGQYTLTGQIWNKSTGKLLREVEPVVTEFTAPDSGQGSVDVRFVLDTTQLAGVDLVVGETLTDRRGQVVAEHVDLNDAYQTVRVGAPSSQAPSLGTVATGERHDSTVACSTSAVITDNVYYYNLAPGESYSLVTRLMGKSDGKEIEASRTTTVLRPSVASGVVQVSIPVDTSKLAGQSLVVYETLSLAGREVAYHEDLNDSAQTVTVRQAGDDGDGPADPDTTDPWVNGTATDASNGGHTLTLSANAVIRVSANYGNLKPGQAYTLVANVQDVTRAELTGLGPRSVQFTAVDGGRGSVSLDIPVDTTKYVGHELEVYLTINDGATPLATHNDLADQYLKVSVGKITTLLTGKDGKSKSVALSSNTTLRDTVYFGNLVPGKSYAVNGYIIDLDGPAQQASQQASQQGAQGQQGSQGSQQTAVTVMDFVANTSTKVFHRQGCQHINDMLDANKLIMRKSAAEMIAAGYTPCGTCKPGPATGTQSQTGTGNLSLSEDFQAAAPAAGQLTTVGGVVVPYSGEYIATASAAFTPTEAAGSTTLDFNVNTAGRNGHRLVCLEVLTDGNYVVAVHVDTGDADQTVTVRTQVSAQTGATPIRMVTAIASAIMTCVFGAYTLQAVARRRKLGE